MSEHDEKPDQIDKTPDQIVGRTYADLVIHTQTGKKLDAALVRLGAWSVERVKAGAERVRKVFKRTDQLLEEGNVENPKAIPERVGVEILENVAREDREELFELWSRLLVGSARGNDVDAFHIDTVRKLDPSSVRVFLAIADKLLPKLSPTADNLVARTIAAVADLCHLENKHAEQACARLLALGLIHSIAKSRRPKMLYELTGFGEQLLIILYPDGREERSPVDS